MLRRRSALWGLSPSFSWSRRARSAAAGEKGEIEEEAAGDEGRWARMLPELLGDVVRRVEAGGELWPLRKDVVSCAGVCRRWREVARGIVGSPLDSGKITFPSSLKEPGSKDFPIQCFIRRNKRNSTFYLYLGLAQAFMEKGKFLMAARQIRNGAQTEYIISLDPDDISQGSNAYMGKLRSGFWGTNFVIYDSQPPHNGAKASRNRSSRRFASKQISPQVPSSNFEIGRVSYKFNLLKSRGPRRIVCTLECTAKDESSEDISPKLRSQDPGASIILRNKAPRWHEHLQCWCLNFHGRVTMASVKNFQLVQAPECSRPPGVLDDNAVLLQFGKVNKDMFTMDYRQPLSAFQAFAICLTSFGTKLACE